MNSRSMNTRSGSRLIAALIAVGLSVALAACASGNPLSGNPAPSKSGSMSLTIGATGSPENQILAQLYGQVLAANGFTVSYNPGIGSREAFVPGLQDGSIDLIPDYTGNLLYFVDTKATATSAADVNAALVSALPKDLQVLKPAEAVDSDSLTVTSKFAAEHNLKSIADLAPIASTITLGANTEFETRPYGRPGLDSVYGVKGFTFKAIDDYGGAGTLSDLLDNTIQVADIYTTTPSIKQNKLVVLDDPKHLIAAQNIVPLLNKKVYSEKLATLLDGVSAKLTTSVLTDLNTISNGADKPLPEKIAKDWLTQNGFLK